MTVKSRTLTPQPLSRQAFAPFGEVLRPDGATAYAINAGTTMRFNDLARIDTDEGGGRTLLSLFRAQPVKRPFRVRMMERHPLGSQAFLPLTPRPFLVLVAPAGPPPRPEDLTLFITAQQQGVNFARGVWHHPLMALDAESDFWILDRGGPGENCDEHHFADDVELLIP